MLAKKLWTIEEYQRLAETGIFQNSDRTELIDGEIILMSPKGLVHVVCCQNLIRELSKILTEGYILDCQNPIILGDRDEPEPDLTIIKPNYTRRSLPKPDNIQLVIEVSDTTLKYDQEIKLRKYAAANIPNYWIFNLVDRVLEMYFEPLPQSRLYAQSRTIPPTKIIPQFIPCFTQEIDLNKVFVE